MLGGGPALGSGCSFWSCGPGPLLLRWMQQALPSSRVLSQPWIPFFPLSGLAGLGVPFPAWSQPHQDWDCSSFARGTRTRRSVILKSSLAGFTSISKLLVIDLLKKKKKIKEGKEIKTPLWVIRGYFGF